MEEDTMHEDAVTNDQDTDNVDPECKENNVDDDLNKDESIKPPGKGSRGRPRGKLARRGRRGRPQTRKKQVEPDDDELDDLGQELDEKEETIDRLSPSITNRKKSVNERRNSEKSDKHSSAGEDKEEPASHNNTCDDEDEDQFLGFKDVDVKKINDFNSFQKDRKSMDKDSASEDSENEGKASDRDVSRKRGRGRQWKRGRRKKSPTAPRLPQNAINGLPDYLQEEMQHSFEIYTILRTVPKIGPFIDKPSSNMFGMSTYYNEVTSPMWLKEVERKLMCHGYKSMTEFILDIRLILENCYKFWGADHKFSRIAMQLETKVEQKIDSLPSPLKEKCKDAFLDGCDGDILNMDVDDFRSYSEESNDILRSKCKNFPSKIMRKLENSKMNNHLLDFDKEKEEKIISWERSHLGKVEVKNDISSMWQLAAIGTFFKFAQPFLNVKHIKQYELERMLLIPKESSTLATLMTSMLSSASNRTKLDATVPIMSFQVWNKRLQKKVEDWFNNYKNKNGNETEVFTSCGIDPQFWQDLSFDNPFDNGDFSEMTFHERCIIFKALCDSLCHSCKSIQESLLDEDSETALEFSDTILGCVDYYTYFYLPFWPDVRVYRTKGVSSKLWNSSKNLSILTNKFLSILVVDSHQDSNNVTRSKLFEDFALVADSTEDLLALIEQVKGLNQSLSSRLKSYHSKVKENCSSSLPVLAQLWQQWNDYSIRTDAMDAESQSYWELIDGQTVAKYFDVEDPAVLGKRQRRNICISPIHSTEDEDELFEEVPELEDDGSDWECSSGKKKAPKKPPKQADNDSDTNNSVEPKAKKKRGPPKGPRAKKVKDEQNDKPPKKSKLKSPPLDNSLPTLVIKKVLSLESNELDDIKPLELKSTNDLIKTETVSVKVELDDSDMDTMIKSNTVEIKQEPILLVKKELNSDNNTVISLSSNDEEEDDDDVIITTPIKQVVPASPKVRTPVASNVRPTVPMSPSTPRLPSPIVRTPTIPSPRMSAPNTPQNSPRVQFTTSPRLVSPRGQPSPHISPRQMSPLRPGFPPAGGTPGRFNTSPMQMMQNSRMRGMSPRGFPPVNQVRSPAQTPPQASRNLFGNRPQTSPQQQQPNRKGITAKLTFGKRDDGSYGYLARLSDGGVINMSPQQIENIKKKHGTIPPVISIPFQSFLNLCNY